MNNEGTSADTPSKTNTHIICEKCNKLVRLEELFEHEDYHVAQKLNREMYKEQVSENVTNNKKRRQRSIVGFFGAKKNKKT